MRAADGDGGPAGGAAPGGELFAVIGPAGPARTSLLRALGGRLRWSGGRGGGAGEVRRRVALARAFGAAAPDPYARVGELLDRADAGAIGRALDAAGLTVVDHPGGGGPGLLARGARYGRLPVADRILLAVALALAGAPDALLVDAVDDGHEGRESPDGQGDPAGDRVWTRLRGIADSGTTVVAACSTATAAGGYADRTVLLPHGAHDHDTAGYAHAPTLGGRRPDAPR